MIQYIDAIYEHGVLKPLGSLDLEDHEMVSLSIQKRPHSNGTTDVDERTLFEMFNEAGLIGCVKDAPPDLSTNPKYLEGFGSNRS